MSKILITSTFLNQVDELQLKSKMLTYTNREKNREAREKGGDIEGWIEIYKGGREMRGRESDTEREREREREREKKNEREKKDRERKREREERGRESERERE